MNETFIYLDQSNEVHGPFPLDVICALLQNGAISAQTLISDGVEPWEAVCIYHKTSHIISSLASVGAVAQPAAVYNQFFVAAAQGSSMSRVLYIVLAVFLGGGLGYIILRRD